ncbi:MAG: hypothetical protein K6G42_08460 [Lachnospiraceae bacterium]|nr:hypothetical protein [Lachnospiraceae bacterium]
MKTYEILGIRIRDYSVREALHSTTELLSDNTPSIVFFLTRGVLLGATDSEEHKAFMEEGADITMVASSDIFKAANVSEKGREREIERNLYIKGLLRMLSREHRRIYLMTQNAVQMEELKTLLGTFENALQIAGSFVNTDGASVEDITNDINTVTPYVVFAVMDGNEGIDFVSAGKKYMNTRLMIVLQPEMLKVKEDGSVKKGFTTKLSEKLFTRIAGRYKE